MINDHRKPWVFCAISAKYIYANLVHLPCLCNKQLETSFLIPIRTGVDLETSPVLSIPWPAEYLQSLVFVSWFDLRFPASAGVWCPHPPEGIFILIINWANMYCSLCGGDGMFLRSTTQSKASLCAYSQFSGSGSILVNLTPSIFCTM